MTLGSEFATARYPRRTRLLLDVTGYATLVLIALILLAPIAWLFLTSLKTPLELFSLALPAHPSLASYQAVFNGQPLFSYLRNSLITATGTTIIAISFAVLAAYGFTRYPFPGSRILFMLVLITRTIPGIALIIPLYLIFGKISLLNTLQGLILAQSAFALPFAIWLLEGFLRDVPRDLDDAGLVDGCTRLSVLVFILLPVMLPGLAVAAIFSFLLSWNDFLFGLIMTSTPAAQTLPVGLSSMTLQYGVRWDELSAAGMIYILPTLLMAIMLQRYIVRGLTGGAVKG